jgi:uncharacterized DUF497 family protein
VTKGALKEDMFEAEDLYTAFAQIESGRYLIVFFINKGSQTALPISARDMNDAEERYYEKHR